MVEKLFVLGCSGSGKSTAARYLARLVGSSGCSVARITDYGYLYEKFKAHTGDEKFASACYDGFEVYDLTVYDTALKWLEGEVIQRSKKNEMVIIEFARADYREALKLFNDGFLQNAYFLYLTSRPDACIDRIHERVVNRTTLDDHFVPDNIVTSYRHQDNRSYIANDLKKDFAVSDEQIGIISNNESLEKFIEHLEQYFETIILPKLPIPMEMG